VSFDDILTLFVTLVAIAIAYGLTHLVYRAREDRSALLALYLLLGIPGALIAIVGAAFAFSGHDGGWIVLVASIGLCAPLVRPIRRFFATWMPMDPDSPVDMAGLCVILCLIGFLSTSYVLSPEPADTGGDVSIASLLVQFVAEIVFAFILVGFTITRDWRQALARLGLVRPTPRLVAIAVGLVVVAYIVVLAGGLATYFLQRDVSDEINRITREITSGAQNPIGAALFGLGAGAGEELLLRGAIQPRYGLLTTSVTFALLHSQYGISFVQLSIFVVGIILGLERKYLGTTASIITHGIFDTIAVLI
jgi:membrane protease YdiL (CAAX protease family)